MGTRRNIQEKINIKIKVMSDSIKKWYEGQEMNKNSSFTSADPTYIYESPDKGKTVTRRPIGGGIGEREITKYPIVSEGHKKLAYEILVEYPQEAILEAGRILKVGK